MLCPSSLQVRAAEHSGLSPTMAALSGTHLVQLSCCNCCKGRALSTRCDSPGEASRPWGKGGDSSVGQGAGVLVMESLKLFLSRQIITLINDHHSSGRSVMAMVGMQSAVDAVRQPSGGFPALG